MVLLPDITQGEAHSNSNTPPRPFLSPLCSKHILSHGHVNTPPCSLITTLEHIILTHFMMPRETTPADLTLGFDSHGSDSYGNDNSNTYYYDDNQNHYSPPQQDNIFFGNHANTHLTQEPDDHHYNLSDGFFNQNSNYT